MCVFYTFTVCSTNHCLSHTFVFLWKISELIKPYTFTFRHMTYLIVFIFLYLVMNDANNNGDRGICFCVYQIHWCRWLEPVATILLFCRVSEEPFRRPSYDLAHRWPWLFCSLCILLWKRYLSFFLTFFLYVLNLISFRWMLEIVLTILSNQNSSRTFGWVCLVNYLVTLERWKCSKNRNISSILNKSVFSGWK